PDLDAKMAQLENTIFVGGVTTTNNGDRRVLALDPSQNVFVIQEARPDTNASFAPVAPTDACAGRDLLGASMRGADIRGMLSPDATWFDDTRNGKDPALARGVDAVVASVAKRWTSYDRSPAGVAAEMTTRDV